MDKIFVSTLNKNLYKSYAHRLISTYTATHQTTPMIVYVEDDIKKYPTHHLIEFRNLFEKEPLLKQFVERNSQRPFDAYYKDACRFSYKVFAQKAASIEEKGKRIFYVDADCVFQKKIPDQWFDRVLGDKFVAFYDRPNQYTETGFIAFDTRKECTQQFFDKYVEWYIKDTVYDLPAYTDCHTFDATRTYMGTFKNDYSEQKLGDGKNAHIMARHALMNEYIDHRKGNRKEQLNSPEWISQRM